MDKKQYFKEKEKIFKPDGAAEIAAFCHKSWPEETAHILRCASDACENRFLFDFPWDMERTWEPYSFGTEIDWNIIPFGDREFLWQFNRHRFMVSMGQAYVLTGEERYGEHFVRLFTDWTEHVQEGENIDLGPWRTLETGIRSENWIRALFLLNGSHAVDEVFLELFRKQLVRHGRRLAEHFALHKYQSNWGAMESTGLLMIALALPEGAEQGLFLATAAERLGIAAGMQVMGDGVHWEQSPMYHNEVYRSFLTASYYADKAGVRLPENIREAARRMAFANLAWKKPDHMQFAQGDSDTTDLRDQLTAGAWYFQDPVLKSGAYKEMDPESAWLFGAGALKKYASKPSQEPEYTSVSLEDSGNFYFRSGWDEKANLLHFRCGDMGAGHGHADKLHLDLVIGGEDILVDSGRYTYVEGAGRYALKGCSGHNTTLVDQEDFTHITDSWCCSRLSTAVKQQFRDGKSAAFVGGGHLGYLEKGVYTTRRVLWIKPDIYLIADAFYTEGEHLYEALFHFSGHGKVEMEERSIVFSGKDQEAFLQFPKEEAELALEDSVQSLHYNQKMPNRCLRVSQRGTGFCSMITVINGGKKGVTAPVSVQKAEPRSVVHNRPFSQGEAEAFRILAEGEGKTREYIVFLAHREIFSPADTAIIDRCMGYGSAIVFDIGKGTKEVVTGEVLSW